MLPRESPGNFIPEDFQTFPRQLLTTCPGGPPVLLHPDPQSSLAAFADDLRQGKPPLPADGDPVSRRQFPRRPGAHSAVDKHPFRLKIRRRVRPRKTEHRRHGAIGAERGQKEIAVFFFRRFFLFLLRRETAGFLLVKTKAAIIDDL